MSGKTKLPKVPVPRKPKATRNDAPAEPAAGVTPDLSHIAEGLRPLAWPVDRLQFHPENPRRHSTEHVDEIAASLRVNGQVKNILASSRTEPPLVVCGNGTLQAALRLGWTHLAVERQALTLERERELLVIDNLTGADPDWDESLLKICMEKVDTSCDPTLDRMLADLAAEEGLIPQDESGTSGSGEGGNTPRPPLTCPECGHQFTPE